jgi:endonuclease YncB( thermonuclease family)
MVNVTMVQLGLASVADDAATLRYAADLLDAEADAREARRGMWGPPPTLTPTSIAATAPLTATVSPTNSSVTPTSSP